MILPSGHSTYDYSVDAHDKGWGRGWPTCSNADQVATITLALSGTRIPVHRRVAKLLLILCNVIERRGYLCGPYGTWGGECRPIGGTSIASNHSWWLAIDIRAPWNSFNSIGEHDIPDWAYALFRAYGFGLGADYDGPKKDWMHVEEMGTPGDVDIMTALAERNFGDGTQEENMALSDDDKKWITGAIRAGTVQDIRQRDQRLAQIEQRSNAQFKALAAAISAIDGVNATELQAALDQTEADIKAAVDAAEAAGGTA